MSQTAMDTRSDLKWVSSALSAITKQQDEINEKNERILRYSSLVPPDYMTIR